MVAVAVSSAAMIIVFSVFNGLEGVVKQLYTGFYPDIRVTVAKGRFFVADSTTLIKVKQIEGVVAMTTVIEDNAIVNNTNTREQKVIMLKGIDRSYMHVNQIADSISGEDSVSMGKPYTAIAGARILNELGADITNLFSTIELYYPNPNNKTFAVGSGEIFRPLELHPAGLFHISDEFDNKYVLAPLPLVQTLFFQEGKITSLELRIAPGAEAHVKSALTHLFGDKYNVETRYEQNKTMFMVMRTEKWAIYAILVMVLLVASFNLVGALSMLVLEKQKDVAILKAMGAGQDSIRTIFLLEGTLWALVGGISGILLGAGFCIAQQQFGFIKVGGSFLMDTYPVDMELPDFLLVIVTIIAVGILAAWYPASRATKAPAPALKSA
jgi:lipoprotein-releasing system permease protein